MKPLPTRALSAVPVFPLPDHFLFPGTVTPLHIFETRYRQMMHDLMDSSGRLVMAPCASGEAPATFGRAGPALPEMGTLVEIVQTEELEDGRWLVLLLALARVSLTEVPSDRLYRKVDARVLPDAEATGAAVPPLCARLVAALRARSGSKGDAMSGDAPVGVLADLLLHVLPLEPERRRRAYTERDPVERARLALAWHAAADAAAGDEEANGG